MSQLTKITEDVVLRYAKDEKHREAVFVRIVQFKNWAEMHPDRMKEPDSQQDEGWTSAGTPSGNIGASASDIGG